MYLICGRNVIKYNYLRHIPGSGSARPPAKRPDQASPRGGVLQVIRAREVRGLGTRLTNVHAGCEVASFPGFTLVLRPILGLSTRVSFRSEYEGKAWERG